MHVSYAVEPAARDADDNHDRAGADGSDTPVIGPLRHELRTNLGVACFSLGLSTAVAVGLALLMTLLG